jgi:hypothetical protein
VFLLESFFLDEEEEYENSGFELPKNMAAISICV